MRRSPPPRGFNPRSPCGERRSRNHHRPSTGRVSTHAPLAGSDTTMIRLLNETRSFNPRSPCGERRHSSYRSAHGSPFQPTLPLRGATKVPVLVADWLTVSTHAPLAGSDLPARRLHHHIRVSTHAPLAGSDARPRSPCGTPPGFNPRSPCGERRPVPTTTERAPCFNPRSPCGERQAQAVDAVMSEWFQPTLPLRGATSSRCPGR